MSWPDLACASAAPVSSSLLPCEVMKSTWTSTFSLAAHSSIAVLVALLALGTQWSHMARLSLPAACAPRTKGAATKVDAATLPATKRRRVVLEATIFPPVTGPQAGPLAGTLGMPAAVGNGIPPPLVWAKMRATNRGGNDAPVDRGCHGLGRHRRAAFSRKS